MVPRSLPAILVLSLATACAGPSRSGRQAGPNPEIVLKTELGDIVVELYPARAPVTVANFLRYIDEGRFEGATFYRVVTMGNQPQNPVRIEVIQGGLRDDESKRGLPPIAHETTAVTGLRHRDGTISMARLEPGTASSEFFICMGDQPELDFGGKRNPDGRGFAAFGRVTKGMEFVRAIQGRAAEGQTLKEVVAIRSVGRHWRRP